MNPLPGPPPRRWLSPLQTATWIEGFSEAVGLGLRHILHTKDFKSAHSFLNVKNSSFMVSTFQPV